MRPSKTTGANWGPQRQLYPRGAGKHIWRSLAEELSVPVWKDTDPNIPSEQEEDKKKVLEQLPGEQLTHTPVNALSQEWNTESETL